MSFTFPRFRRTTPPPQATKSAIIPERRPLPALPKRGSMHARPAITEILPVVTDSTPRPDYTDPRGLAGLSTLDDDRTVVMRTGGHDPLPPSQVQPPGCTDSTITLGTVVAGIVALRDGADYLPDEEPVDLPAPSPKRWRRFRAPVDGDTPTDVSRHLQRAVAGFRAASAATAPIDQAEAMRRADELAAANDARFDRLTAATRKWEQDFLARFKADQRAHRLFEAEERERQARLDAAKERAAEEAIACRRPEAEAVVVEIWRRHVSEDPEHPASTSTLAAGMLEAAKMRADLDALLAADGRVSA